MEASVATIPTPASPLSIRCDGYLVVCDDCPIVAGDRYTNKGNVYLINKTPRGMRNFRAGPPM